MQEADALICVTLSTMLPEVIFCKLLKSLSIELAPRVLNVKTQQAKDSIQISVRIISVAIKVVMSSDILVWLTCRSKIKVTKHARPLKSK